MCTTYSGSLNQATNSVLSRHLKIPHQQAVTFWGQCKSRPQFLSRIVEDLDASVKAIQERAAGLLASALETHCLYHVERIHQLMTSEPKSAGKKARR